MKETGVNLHLDNTSNNQIREFRELLDTLNVSQLVNQPTHRLGHTLDCIITEQDANLVNYICVHTPWISDHSLVAFKLSIQKPAVFYKTVITRDWKSLNLDQLNYDIMKADLRQSSNVVSECVVSACVDGCSCTFTQENLLNATTSPVVH